MLCKAVSLRREGVSERQPLEASFLKWRTKAEAWGRKKEAM
jgi:hypothetical protein